MTGKGGGDSRMENGGRERGRDKGKERREGDG